MGKVIVSATLDGHKAKMQLRNRYLRLVSQQFWIYIFSKNTKNLVICSRPFYTQQQALDYINQFTLENYIKELQS